MAAEAPAAGRDVPVGAHSSLDAGSYATWDAGRHPSLDTVLPAARDTGRHPSLDAAPLPVRENGRHPSLDAAPLPVRENGRHPSLDTGPHATRGTGAHARKAAPPPVPGALEDDPLTSPSFSMKADPATDSRSYGHARKGSRSASPTGPLSSDPLGSNGA